MLLVDEALREIDTTVPLFVASRPLAIHISILQCIAIFAVPRSPGSFLSVLFIANDWVLSLPGLTCPFLSVLFITNVRILSLLGLTRPRYPSVFSDHSSPRREFGLLRFLPMGLCSPGSRV